MSSLRGKKKILKHAAQTPKRAGVNDVSNNPRPFAKNLPSAKVRIEADEEGRIKTFDVRTGEYRWMSVVQVR